MITHDISVRLALVSVVFSGFFFGAATASAARNDADQGFPGAARVAERLKKAIEGSELKNGEVGLWVGTTDAEGKIKTVFGQNAEKLFIPASLSKIATAGAVMSQLPPGYKFKTQLLHDPSSAKIAGGVLQGSIYLRGGGEEVMFYSSIIKGSSPLLSIFMMTSGFVLAQAINYYV
ncbi:MAG: D-alanyl-D-alanine carboxypeptidase, partial [Bdellovibrionota bacterium]